jgi:transcriptional regulator with XRE-family HTH domain
MIRDTANNTPWNESWSSEYSRESEVLSGQAFTRLRELERRATVRTVPTVAENIVHLRKAAGYAEAADFARAIRMSPSQLADLETKRHDIPNTRTLLRLAKGLKTTLDALLDGVDPDYDTIRRAVAASGEVETGQSEIVREASKLQHDDALRRTPRRANTPEGPTHGVDVSIPGEPHVESSSMQAVIRELANVARELRNGLTDLRSVNDAFDKRAAALAMASPDEQLATARVLAPKRAGHARQHQRRNARKGSRR